MNSSTVVYTTTDCFTALGSGNSIGCIPLALGGGVCALTKITGTTSDNIISARLVTASGEVQVVDKSTPDLLWAIKGAGQFFGIVTELELQAYPLSVLGSDDGTIWTSKYIFDISKSGEVAQAAARLMDDEENYSVGLSVITANPMNGDPCVLVVAMYFGDSSSAEAFFSPIAALGPLAAMPERTDYQKVNDSFDVYCAKGGYKRFFLAGVPRFDPAPWQEISQIFVELLGKYPEVGHGGYAYEWNSGKQKTIIADSAWAHRDLKCWV